MRLRLPWLPLLLLLMSGPVLAINPDSFAARLAEARKDVESLTDSLSQLKDDLRAKERALDNQAAELAAQTRQEELRLEQLNQTLTRQAEARAAAVAGSAAVVPAVAKSIATLRAGVAAGLPFRQAERLGELDTLQAALESGASTPREVASRLWSFVEDERRLASQSALDRQIITLNGQEVLADVARLGMVSLYYRTDQGELGRAVREGEGWRYEPVTDEAARLQLVDLFDALSKQVRVGFFTIPAAIPEVTP